MTSPRPAPRALPWAVLARPFGAPRMYTPPQAADDSRLQLFQLDDDRLRSPFLRHGHLDGTDKIGQAKAEALDAALPASTRFLGQVGFGHELVLAGQQSLRRELAVGADRPRIE